MKVYALHESECWESWVKEIYLDKAKAEVRRQELVEFNEECLRRSAIYDKYRVDDTLSPEERWERREEILDTYQYRCGQGSTYSITEWEVIE